MGGHPMIQLDVQHRCFYLFGSTFNSQDVWLVLLLALSFLFALLFVTAWKGRVWCGWACPQTVFLEGLYRPIERFFDGPREVRLRLAAAPWTASKVAKRLGKYSVFLFLSAVIAHTATALFVSPAELALMLVEGPSHHWEAFGLTLGFTAVLMFNFSWFREQFCVVLCPYGRLQSVLHGSNSVTVAYRTARGEPRGKVLKAPSAPIGDCIDCNRCVAVCPTGIDIRNGLQMECLACTACIDACDEMMDKVQRPRGLIAFASQNEIQGLPQQAWSPRLILYASLAATPMVGLGISLAMRVPFEANVIRPRGAMPFAVDREFIRNAFEIHVFNKNPARARFHIEVNGVPPDAQVVIGTRDIELESLRDALVPISVSIPRKTAAVVPLQFQVIVKDDTHGAVLTRSVGFLQPDVSNLRSP